MALRLKKISEVAEGPQLFGCGVLNCMVIKAPPLSLSWSGLQALWLQLFGGLAVTCPATWAVLVWELSALPNLTMSWESLSAATANRMWLTGDLVNTLALYWHDWPSTCALQILVELCKRSICRKSVCISLIFISSIVSIITLLYVLKNFHWC